MSDCGSGARNSFCSYLARIQRSFSSLRVEQRHTPAGLCRGAGAPALPFEHPARQVPARPSPGLCAHRAAPDTRRAHSCTDLRPAHLRAPGRALTPRAAALVPHGEPSGPSTRCPALPRPHRAAQGRPAPRRTPPAAAGLGAAALSAALSLLPSRPQPTKAVAASVPPGAAGPPDRCAPCRRYLLPFCPSASGGRPSMPRAEHAHCSRPLTRSYPLISGRMGSCWDE